MNTRDLQLAFILAFIASSACKLNEWPGSYNILMLLAHQNTNEFRATP